MTGSVLLTHTLDVRTEKHVHSARTHTHTHAHTHTHGKLSACKLDNRTDMHKNTFIHLH